MKSNIKWTGTLLLAFMLSIFSFIIDLREFHGVLFAIAPIAASLAGYRKFLDTKLPPAPPTA